jgi:hypothetical protein
MLNRRLPVPLIAVCHFRPREASMTASVVTGEGEASDGNYVVVLVARGEEFGCR